MFRTKYSLAEVARMLKRSEASLIRDIESGAFVLGRAPVGRRRGGGHKVYEISLKDLKGYLGEKEALRLVDPSHGREEPVKRPTQRTTELGTVKRCPSCGRLKPLDDFPRDYSRSDGLAKVCKDCSLSRRWR